MVEYTSRLEHKQEENENNIIYKRENVFTAEPGTGEHKHNQEKKRKTTSKRRKTYLRQSWNPQLVNTICDGLTVELLLHCFLLKT